MPRDTQDQHELRVWYDDETHRRCRKQNRRRIPRPTAAQIDKIALAAEILLFGFILSLCLFGLILG